MGLVVAKKCNLGALDLVMWMGYQGAITGLCYCAWTHDICQVNGALSIGDHLNGRKSLELVDPSLQYAALGRTGDFGS